MNYLEMTNEGSRSIMMFTVTDLKEGMYLNEKKLYHLVNVLNPGKKSNN